MKWDSCRILNPAVLVAMLALSACSDEMREEVAACDQSKPSKEMVQRCSDALKIADLSENERIHVLFSRGVIFEMLKDTARARSDFDSIKNINAQSPYVPRGYAFIARSTGDHARSLALYEEAIRLDPTDAALLGLRGYARFSLGRYDEAIDDLSIAIDPPSNMKKISVGNWHLHYYRGASFAELGDFHKALDDLDKAVDDVPDASWARQYRGLVRYRLGHLTDAASDFDAAMRLGGSLDWIRNELAEVGNFYFGPQSASYEDGVRYGMAALASLQQRYPDQSESAISTRKNQLFPKRLFARSDFLFALESGIAPLTLQDSSEADRVASVYYYGTLINTLNNLNDPTCRAVIRSLDQLAADLATTRDVFGLLGRLSKTKDGGAVLGGLAVMLIGAAFVAEMATDDAVMLASRHGCDSDVVINILETGSKYVSWSVAQ